ncbi:unknown [Bacteroides sp. CAG:189]|nr:unknown [Bacteroides sp. CAG:189]
MAESCFHSLHGSTVTLFCDVTRYQYEVDILRSVHLVNGVLEIVKGGSFLGDMNVCQESKTKVLPDLRPDAG